MPSHTPTPISPLCLLPRSRLGVSPPTFVINHRNQETNFMFSKFNPHVQSYVSPSSHLSLNSVTQASSTSSLQSPSHPYPSPKCTGPNFRNRLPFPEAPPAAELAEELLRRVLTFPSIMEESVLAVLVGLMRGVAG